MLRSSWIWPVAAFSKANPMFSDMSLESSEHVLALHPSLLTWSLIPAPSSKRANSRASCSSYSALLEPYWLKQVTWPG